MYNNKLPCFDTGKRLFAIVNRSPAKIVPIKKFYSKVSLLFKTKVFPDKNFIFKRKVLLEQN